MGPLCSILLATHLVLLQGSWEFGDTLLTVPQRDALRSRADPASASISADGHSVAFVSHARLVPADTNNWADIYVLNPWTGEVTLESLESDGTPVLGSSGFPRLSGDGRYLTFDAAVDDDGGMPTVQVLLRDRTTRTTVWIGRTAQRRFPNGWSQKPAISADGSVVVFTSAATDLTPGDDEIDAPPGIYMYTVASGHVGRISVDTRGQSHPIARSYAPGVSASGRFVTFVSTAELGERPRAGGSMPGAKPLGNIYVRDLHTGVTARLTASRDGQPANGGSWAPAISGDGRYVAFASAATNLVEGDRNRAADVFLHDRRTAVTTLVSRSARRGAANGTSINPVISDDGRFIAFQSDASDLVCARTCTAAHEDINLVFDVFVFDRTTGSMRRLSAARDRGWMEESGGPVMSADGSVVAFTSRHPIDPADAVNDFDLFINTGKNRRPERQEGGDRRTRGH